MSQFPEMPPSLVEDFVRRYIDSVAELEALVLASSDPSTSWDAPHFAERLYISHRAAAMYSGRFIVKTSSPATASCSDMLEHPMLWLQQSPRSRPPTHDSSYPSRR